MNVLSRDQQIQIIAGLTEGLAIRAIERLTGIHRDTIMRLGLKVGLGCAALHDGLMVGLRPARVELDELWAFVGSKQINSKGPHAVVTGDQYTYVAMAASTRAILSYRTGKRNADNTEEFLYDLRERVIGTPEFSTDGFPQYKRAISRSFGNAAHGAITKTYSVHHLTVSEASRRYSPAQVIKVEREVINGLPEYISTSYVERSHLTLRQSCKRFARLGNGYSKKLDNHCAAVALYVMYYNFVRTHETLKTTPAVAQGVADHAWSMGELLDAAIGKQPITPHESAPDRRRKFRVIDGGKID